MFREYAGMRGRRNTKEIIDMNSRKGLKTLKFFPPRYKYTHSKYSSTPNKRSWVRRFKLWALHEQSWPLQELILGPHVALAHVGGAPLALPAAPVLLTLVQEEQLVRSPGDKKAKADVIKCPANPQKQSEVMPDLFFQDSYRYLLPSPHPGICGLLLFTKAKALCKFPTFLHA